MYYEVPCMGVAIEIFVYSVCYVSEFSLIRVSFSLIPVAACPHLPASLQIHARCGKVQYVCVYGGCVGC